MKYLKYLLGVVALLGLIFIGRGMITPSISYTSEITVDKSIKEAWAVMNDESKTTEWLKDITKVELVSGERGTVGAVTNYTFEQDGQAQMVQETLTAIRPHEHIAMDFAMDGAMTMNYAMDFTEKEGKTHIQSSTTTTGTGMFMRSLVAFMQGTFLVQEEENMNNLKQLINNNTTDYFPASVVDTLQLARE